MNSKYETTYHRYSEQSILIQWPQIVSNDILDDIVVTTELIKSHFKKKVINIIPAYASLLILFDEAITTSELKEVIKDRYNDQIKYNSNTWHIPVCYDSEFAIDIGNFDFSYDEVVNIHLTSTYRVFMMGFLPGFIYLGGLHPSLHLERKATPSRLIKKGSVAIGGQQTGIYPMNSPGGWHVIGNSPLDLFDMNSETPSCIKQGDRIEFYQISKDEHKKLS